MEQPNQENTTSPQIIQPQDKSVNPDSQTPPLNKRKIPGFILALVILVIAVSLIFAYIFRDVFFASSAEQEQRNKDKVTGVSNSPTPTVTILEASSDLDLYRNEQFHYKLAYPATWEIIEARHRIGSESAWRDTILSAKELQKVTFLEQGEKNLLGSFQVRVEENANSDDIETWIEDNTPTTVSGASLISDVSDITLDDEEGKNLTIYKFDHSDTNIVVKKNSDIYVLEFTKANPNDPYFDEHKKVYEKMLSSFKFIK